MYQQVRPLRSPCITSLPPGGGPHIFATSDPGRTPGGLTGGGADAGDGAASGSQRETNGYQFVLQEQEDFGIEL